MKHWKCLSSPGSLCTSIKFFSEFINQIKYGIYSLGLLVLGVCCRRAWATAPRLPRETAGGSGSADAETHTRDLSLFSQSVCVTLELIAVIQYNPEFGGQYCCKNSASEAAFQQQCHIKLTMEHGGQAKAAGLCLSVCAQGMLLFHWDVWCSDVAGSA